METEIKFNRLVFALATSSLEDVPAESDSTPEDTSLLQDYHAAWTALWSPRIVGTLGFLPESRRSDTSGLDIENALIVVPRASESKLDQPLEERLLVSGNQIVHSKERPRDQIIDDVCRWIHGAESWESPQLSDQAKNLENDFCAFGFAVMQVQQMARKLRYSFNLDWMIVSDQLIQAANYFNTADYQQADHWLAAAYDSLSQERDRYCSQQGFLLHLVLSASSTIGSRFSKEMQREIPTSLYATGETLEKLKESNREAFDQLLQRIEDKTVAIVGGFYRELKHTYLTEQALHRSFLKAAKNAHASGTPKPKVLLPFHPSIPAHLPTTAKTHGFDGVLLAKFLDGMVPDKEHAKLKWQSVSDGPSIDAILGHVIDATQSHALLELGASMAKQLDYHQVPTLVLAHWPDRTNSIFEDLVRTMRRTPALGKWILADEYFASTSQPYWSDQFGPSHFPFAIPSHPDQIHSLQLSLVHLHRLLYGFERLSETLTCWALASRKPSDSSQKRPEAHLLEEIQKSLEQIDAIATHGEEKLYQPESWAPSFQSAFQSLLEQTLSQIARWMGPSDRWTVLHSASHPRRVCVELPVRESDIQVAKSDRIVSASALTKDSSRTQVVVDVPPWGFARIPTATPEADTTRGSGRTAPESGKTSKSKNAGLLSKLFGHRPSIGQPDGSLANEFMELQVDPKKGHLRSVHIRDQRGNRLSGMVSLALKPAGEHHRVLESDLIGLSQVRVEQHDLSESESVITTKAIFQLGSSASGSNPWIEQSIRMQRGSKWFDVSIAGGGFDRQAHTPLWRIVWPSQAATLQTWTHGNRTKWLGPLQGNIELIEIDDAEHKVYYATGGLSYHVKSSANQLQSLLPIEPDGTLSVSVKLGIDWQRPWETSIDLFQAPWLIPPSVAAGLESGVRQSAGEFGQPKPLGATGISVLSGWLAQCNHPNLRFSMLSPGDSVESLGIYRQEDKTIEPDAWILISEGAGKSSTAKISLPKKVAAAWKVDFSGQLLDKIPSEGSDLVIPYAPWEKSVLAVVLDI